MNEQRKKPGLGDAIQAIDEAASVVVGAAESVIEQITNPETIHNAVRAAIGAALSSVVDDASRAMSAPLPVVRMQAPPASRPPPARPPSSAVPRPSQRAVLAPAAPASSAPRSNLFTPCDKHGQKPWTNTVRCKACRRCYHIEDPSSPRAALDRCPCGAQLLPSKGDRPQPFTAEPVCVLCFIHACDHAGGFAR